MDVETLRRYLGGRIHKAWCWLVCGQSKCGRVLRTPGLWHDIQKDGGTTVRGRHLKQIPGERSGAQLKTTEFGACGTSQSESRKFESAFAQITMKPEL